MNKIRYLLITLTFLILYSNLMAQGKWEVYTKEDGLKSNNISQIYKDSKGNLWFNTATALKGIIKFDGKNWSYFSKDSGLPSNIITSIAEDNDGNIWFVLLRVL